MSLFSVLKFIANHPVNRGQKLASIGRFAKWQISSRLAPGAILYDWINDSSMNISFRFLEESIRQENLMLRFEEVGDTIQVNVELINHVEFVGKKSIEIKGKVL